MSIQHQLKIRFCETDANGHVSNISFFIYLEEARIHFFEKLGIFIDLDKWSFVAATVSCDFVSEAHFGEELIISTSVVHIGTKSIQLDSIMTDSETGCMVAKGKCVMVYFNTQERKTEPLPDSIREKLQTYALEGKMEQ